MSSTRAIQARFEAMFKYEKRISAINYGEVPESKILKQTSRDISSEELEEILKTKEPTISPAVRRILKRYPATHLSRTILKKAKEPPPKVRQILKRYPREHLAVMTKKRDVITRHEEISFILSINRINEKLIYIAEKKSAESKQTLLEKYLPEKDDRDSFEKIVTDPHKKMYFIRRIEGPQPESVDLSYARDLFFTLDTLCEFPLLCKLVLLDGAATDFINALNSSKPFNLGQADAKLKEENKNATGSSLPTLRPGKPS